MKLDLGAGASSPAGYTPMGNAFGTPIYPLPHGAGTVEDIRCSHALEHFPHGEVAAVLADWFRALRPGGTLRIAVPDFERIAEGYLAGEKQNVQGYLMGGQIDAADYHRSLFDEATLKQALAVAGFVLIRRWDSELTNDGAAMPISLNLEGTKPHRAELGVSAVMSAPRIGFMDNFAAVQQGLRPIGGRLRIVQGAYWGQCLERGMEEAMRDDHADAILTLDYDTVFRSADLAMLIQLMMAYPEAHAITGVQAGRGKVDSALFTMRGDADKDGLVHVSGPRTFGPDLAKISTAHFGLTLIRADKLRELPHPWFLDKPDDEGRWGEGRVDADIGFWRKWEAAGFGLYLANRVPIGHLELGVLWPGRDFKPLFQTASEWRKHGAPEGRWQ